MFPERCARYNGRKPVDEALCGRARARWEPLYEITQIKGDGETHPLPVSPDDEFADYETWDVRQSRPVARPRRMRCSAHEYARSALLLGLATGGAVRDQSLPVRLLRERPTVTRGCRRPEEDNFFGKACVGSEPARKRMEHPVHADRDWSEFEGWSAGRLRLDRRCGRWRTRARRIFDAMERREVYATTGPRMIVRFFGGWDFDGPDDVASAPAGLRRIRQGRTDGRRPAGPRAMTDRGTDLHGLRIARSDRRQSRPDPDRQGMARRSGRDP